MTEPDDGSPKALRGFVRWMSLTSLTALLFFGGVYVSPIGFWGLLFCPTPLALLGLREGVARMTVGLLAVVLTILLTLDPLWTVYFLFSEGLLCYALVLPVRARRTPPPERGVSRMTGGEALLLCAGVSIVLKLLLVVVFYWLTGGNPLLPDGAALLASLREAYPEIWMGEGAQSFALRDAIDEMLLLLPYMLPALLLILAGLDSFVNYKLCEVLQRRQRIRLAPLPAFKDWRFPKSLMWPMLLAFVVPFFLRLDFASTKAVTALNLKVLVNIFFFLQGASLIWWCLIRFKVMPLFRLLALILFSLPLAWPWLSFLGIGDLFFDIRSRLKRTES